MKRRRTPSAALTDASSFRRISALVVAALGLSTVAAVSLGSGNAATPDPTAPSASAEFTTIRLVTGTPFTDRYGRVWTADTGAVGGRTYTTKAAIRGAVNPELYQTERHGMSAYRLPISRPGIYRVTLKEAEIWWNSAGKRVFDVTAEGDTVVNDLDIFARAGGKNRATEVSFDVPVTDGTLDLGFTASIDEPKVGAIRVYRLSAITAPSTPGATPRTTPTKSAPTTTVTPKATPATPPPVRVTADAGPITIDVPAPAGKSLVWSDEFDTGTTPDTDNWNFEKGYLRNNELQYYQQQNASLQNGNLVIEARRENVGGMRYTSASLFSRGKQEFQYGTFEIRARVDARPGLWPAIWTLGANDRPWPAKGETDIMEYFNNSISANWHWGINGHLADNNKVTMAELLRQDPQWASKFHVWKLDWDADAMTVSVDGRVVSSFDINTATQNGYNPYRQKTYFLLNLAIGGTVGGDPSGTAFPAKFEVDYVRVFQ